MRIAEIFYSVQGEGNLLGTPSVFIRTSGCNLRCVWCDTPYTSWKPEGRDWALREILAETKHYDTRYAVITGGEPLLAHGIETAFISPSKPPQRSLSRSSAISSR